MSSYWWRVKDLNLRRQSRGIYSPLPLAARATRQGFHSMQHAQITAFKRSNVIGYWNAGKWCRESEGVLIIKAGVIVHALVQDQHQFQSST